jgi:oxygen-independent coproporphyrinogen-3 oxidase
MPDAGPNSVASLYVHVPFCAQKCSYCAFYSEPSSGEVINRYVAALIREIEMVADRIRPETVFFGGGTPSILNAHQWEQILKAMDRLKLLGAAEWTVECNPATVSLDKARLLRSYGVNRISMGVQSLDEALLDRLGRVHTRQMAFKSYDILRKAEFQNVNLDLMFAIPTQTLEIWGNTLKEVVAMQSEHLSTYEVIYEDDTPLFAQLKAGQVAEDEDLSCEMFDLLLESAQKAGFVQYEVANFAKNRSDRSDKPDLSDRSGDGLIPSLACRHNLNYWRGGSFFGLGPSATSYVDGVRSKNWSNTQLYCEQIEKGNRAVESREELAPQARAGETAAFGLRMVAGLFYDEFRKTTGFDLREGWEKDMRELEGKGWGAILPDRFHLTPEGMRFADTAAELFLR